MSFIKEFPHVEKKPVSVERELPDILVIEGVRYAGDLFRTLTDPNDSVLYAIRKDEDGVLRVIVIHNALEAMSFFEDVNA
jgi:hypothetical protein